MGDLAKIYLTAPPSSCDVERLFREETDYRFEIIVYMHRKFQMFEFPPFINVNKREKSVPSFFQIQIIN